jgi:hypothetical protein
MIGTGNSKLQCETRRGCAALGALAWALVVAWPAFAQEAQPPVSPAPAATTVAPAPAPPPAFRPGFIDAVGRWLGKSKAKLDEGFKDTQQTIGGIGSQAGQAVKGAAGAAKQATGVIVDLPSTRVVMGRQRCPLAPNGAPDCLPAAQALCKYRGFTGGRGLDIDSGQKCPAWVWISGQTPPEGVCRTETFVTRAVCQ